MDFCCWCLDFDGFEMVLDCEYHVFVKLLE